VTGREHSVAGATGGLLLFGILAAGSVLLFLDSWQLLAGRWVQWSYGYDHGWLIAALSAWLVWRERKVLAAGRPCWPGLILVAARALAFPLGFLYFAIPIWDFVNPFLQAATTAVVGVMLAVTGVPRLINLLYDTALTACLVEVQPQVTAEIVEGVVRELKWTERESGAQRSARAATQEGYARLKVTHLGHRIADIVLLDDHNVIGRDQDCQVVIDDKFFSRCHAVIVHEDEGWLLRDLDSTNGTWVNGTAARTCHLKDGDIIEIGKHRLVFVVGRAADVGVVTQSMVDC